MYPTLGCLKGNSVSVARLFQFRKFLKGFFLEQTRLEVTYLQNESEVLETTANAESLPNQSCHDIG